VAKQINMQKKFTYLMILSVSALFIAYFSFSCEDILKLNVAGDGNVIVDTLRWRNGFNISELELADDFILEIYQSEKPAIHVETDSNLMTYVKTELIGKKLIIRRQADHLLKPSKGVIVRYFTNNLSLIEILNRGVVFCDTLTATTLTINAYGKSKFTCQNIDVENFFFRAESGAYTEIRGNFIYLDFVQVGSGESFLRGNVETFRLWQEGSGKIEAFNLEANVAFVTLLHSGLIYCNVSNFLTVDLKGSGRLFYRGDPEIEIIEGEDGVFKSN